MQAQSKTAPSRLGAVRREILDDPLRFLIYGAEGVGKTTLCAHAPNPIAADVEGGSGRVSVARYPFHDGAHGYVPRTLEAFRAGVEDLRVSEHAFASFIIDTVDALEVLVWEYVCRNDGKRAIEDFGYGKGYTSALDEWRVVCAELDRLRTERGMSIIMIGHSMVKNYHNPLGEDYDRITMRLHEKAGGFLRQWSDVVGYCAHDDGAAKKRGDDKAKAKAKGYTTGRRFLHLERSAAWDAKTRVPLPAKVELAIGDSWAAFGAELEQGRHTSAADLVKGIKAELQRIGDPELAKQVKASTKTAIEDTAMLSRYLNNLKAREPHAGETE